ncbi:hypothetical protein B0H17DRAFT_1216482 [Mycena rosella]|uniref:Uncharacterized protein n=1 Tax=Mycena rosella TaxID=1033263 RepID=A0AAD7FVR6_MYCRO|nr:hypothetical protein B0H17DRAFT_1216482 [Mycena rosella]
MQKKPVRLRPGAWVCIIFFGADSALILTVLCVPSLLDSHTFYPLSDAEDFGHDSDNNLDPALKAESKPVTDKDPAAVVSEPKHTPASKFRAQATQSFGNIGEYLKVKMVTDEKKAKAFEAKLELDERRFELDRQKAKVDMAKTVFAMDGFEALLATLFFQPIIRLASGYLRITNNLLDERFYIAVHFIFSITWVFAELPKDIRLVLELDGHIMKDYQSLDDSVQFLHRFMRTHCS